MKKANKIDINEIIEKAYKEIEQIPAYKNDYGFRHGAEILHYLIIKNIKKTIKEYNHGKEISA